jgi:hypothetical protein
MWKTPAYKRRPQLKMEGFWNHDPERKIESIKHIETLMSWLLLREILCSLKSSMFWSKGLTKLVVTTIRSWEMKANKLWKQNHRIPKTQSNSKLARWIRNQENYSKQEILPASYPRCKGCPIRTSKLCTPIVETTRSWVRRANFCHCQPNNHGEPTSYEPPIL